MLSNFRPVSQTLNLCLSLDYIWTLDCAWIQDCVCVDMWTEAFVLGTLDPGASAELVAIQWNFTEGVSGTWVILVGACIVSIKALKISHVRERMNWDRIHGDINNLYTGTKIPRHLPKEINT